MATKKTTKKQLRDAEPTILRNYDPMAMEKRVFDMDYSPMRSWDIYSLEERIHQLEINGGGGGGGATIKIGTFTTESTQYGISEIDCGFKPDLVLVSLPISGKDTTSYWEKNLSYAEEKAPWLLAPAESSFYMNNLGRTTGETGIQDITDNGFKFIVNGSNTRGVACNYVAVKYPEA